MLQRRAKLARRCGRRRFFSTIPTWQRVTSPCWRRSKIVRAPQLLGYAEAAYGARDEDQRAPNEAAAIGRARAIAAAALGDSDFERLHAEGAKLSKDNVAARA